nr:ribonuclease H-like domain-containing protein [Tanacetum cinerariifolium]
QQVCLYMHDPREPYFSALKRVLRYVRGTLDYGLQLFFFSTTDLVAYSDTNWASCPTTRRSTSGYCVFLGNNLLSWFAKRQPTLSRSSAEAEYRGVANAVAETCWLRNLLAYEAYKDRYSFCIDDRFDENLFYFIISIKPETEDVNMKFLWGLPPSWSGIALILKTKGGLEYISFDDMYNKLKFLEIDTKGYSSSPFTLSNVSFVSTAGSSQGNLSYQESGNGGYGGYTTILSASPGSPSSKGSSKSKCSIVDDVIYSFFANHEIDQQLVYEDLDQMNKEEFEEYDLKHQIAMLYIKVHRFEKKHGRKIKFNGGQNSNNYQKYKSKEARKDESGSKAMVVIDGSIDWDKQTEGGNTKPRSLENFGMIARIKIESDADSEGEVVSVDDVIPAGVFVHAGTVAAAVVSPQSETEFALMGLSTEIHKNLKEIVTEKTSSSSEPSMDEQDEINENYEMTLLSEAEIIAPSMDEQDEFNENYEMTLLSEAEIIVATVSFCSGSRGQKACFVNTSGIRTKSYMQIFDFPRSKDVDEVVFSHLNDKFRTLKHRIKKSLLALAAKRLHEANNFDGEMQYTDDEILQALDLVEAPHYFVDHRWESYKVRLREPKIKKVKYKREPNDIKIFEMKHATKLGPYVDERSRVLVSKAKAGFANKLFEVRISEHDDPVKRLEIAREVMQELRPPKKNGRPCGCGVGVTKSQVTKFSFDLRRMRRQGVSSKNRFLLNKVAEQNKQIEKQSRKMNTMEET